MQASLDVRLGEASGPLKGGRAARARSWLAVVLLAALVASSAWSAGRVLGLGSQAQAAASSPGLSVSPSAGITHPGAPLNVDIFADCGTNADAVAMTLTFNPAHLQVVSITPDTAKFPNALLAATYDNTAGTVRYEAGALTCHSAGNCPSGSVHLASIQFATAEACQLSVPLTLSGQLTWAGAYIFNGAGGGGTFAITIAGDVNADGHVNVQDIQLVAAHWSSVQGQTLYDARYDLDADGDVDVVDIMYVAARWNQQCG